MEQEPILKEHNFAESESRANSACFAEPNQGHGLNVHNKQEYPPMLTDEIDTPLKKPSALKQTIDWFVKYWWTVFCFLVLQTIFVVFAMFVFPGGWL